MNVDKCNMIELMICVQNTIRSEKVNLPNFQHVNFLLILFIFFTPLDDISIFLMILLIQKINICVLCAVSII